MGEKDISQLNILAIESSCDDTSAAVYSCGILKSNIIANQEVHRKFGGVVPELASRAHQINIVPVVDQALKEAGIEKEDLDAVAFTVGPGLLGSLLVGISFAKGLAQGLGIPIITVNHMQAHILAHFIDEPIPSFPFICLTVSGGHTQIVVVKSHLEMEVIGETIDDAAGEAFDKTAKMIGLEYPGGPLVDKLAQLGDPKAFNFPEPKAHRKYDFSFSGLKTSIQYNLQKKQAINPTFIQENMNDICASVQYRIVNMLLKKVKLAAEDYGINQIAIAGGVSANSELRKRIVELGDSEGWDVFIPQFQYCTDNAGMIAITAYYQYLKGDFADLSVAPQPRMKF